MSPRKFVRKPLTLRTAEVADILGWSERTLRRKLAAGLLPEPQRDRHNNYRIWTPEEVQRLHQAIEREKS